MKKNRRTPFLCAILCFVMLFSLFSCQQADTPNEESSTAPVVKKILKGYQALNLTASSDSFDPANHTQEYLPWATDYTGPYQDASAPKQKTVTFQGKSYTGEYDATTFMLPETHKRHCYDGDHVLFDVHAVTGELLYFIRTDADSIEAPFTITDEQCLDIAKNAAKEYIDINSYQYKGSKSDELYNHRYNVTFYREIGGYRTNDILVITVSGKGEVVAMYQTMLGSFDGVSSFELGTQTATTILEAKVDSIYQGIDEYRDYEVRNVQLVTLEDGSIALYYLISVKFEREDGSHFGRAVQLLIAPIYEEVTE